MHIKVMYTRAYHLMITTVIPEIGNLAHCWGEYKKWCSHSIRNSREVPKKLKWITIWPGNPTSEYISKGMKIRISKNYLPFHIHDNTIHNSQETTECPKMEEWVRREGVVYIPRLKCYSAFKKKEVLPYRTDTDELRNIISEVSQSQKDQYGMIPPLWSYPK